LTDLDDRDAGLLALLQALDARDYDFVTPSPLSHARVLARRTRAKPHDLRDIFGWNRAFDIGDLSPDLLALVRRADALAPSGDLFTSRYRVAGCGGLLFLHTAFWHFMRSWQARASGMCLRRRVLATLPPPRPTLAEGTAERGH